LKLRTSTTETGAPEVYYESEAAIATDHAALNGPPKARDTHKAKYAEGTTPRQYSQYQYSSRNC